MTKVKRLFCAATMLAATLPNFAQSVEGELATDIVTSYIWRGQEFAGVSIQPTAALSWKSLRLAAWGSYEISGQNPAGKELDITLSFAAKGFTLGLTDYFVGTAAPYFCYQNNVTNHTFEANLGYDLGFLAINWYTNIAGLDGVNQSNGKRAYSSYLQLDAPFKLAKMNWTASLGIVPWNTNFYQADRSHGFHVNNVSLAATRELHCGKHFTLPVFANIIANPSADSMYFLIGCTLKAL